MSEEGQTLILKVTRKLGHISHIGYSTGKWEEPITATFLWNKIRNQRRKNVFTKFNKTEKKVFQELTKNVDRVHIADEQKEQKVLHILRKTSGRGDFLACCQLIQSLDRRASDDRRKLKQVWKSSAKQRQIVNIQVFQLAILSCCIACERKIAETRNGIKCEIRKQRFLKRREFYFC